MSFFTRKIKSLGKNVSGSVSQASLDGGRPLYLVAPFCETFLATGNFLPMVKMPPYVDENEFLAANLFDFYTYTNLLYGAISDSCTSKECPSMSGGPGMEYTWTDAQKKQNKVAAPRYVDSATAWIQSILDDENTYPTRSGTSFPKDFVQIVKSIMRHLFRILAHVYVNHYEMVLNLSLEGHLNTFFTHLVMFGIEHDLIEKKEASATMLELIETLKINWP